MTPQFSDFCHPHSPLRSLGTALQAMLRGLVVCIFLTGAVAVVRGNVPGAIVSGSSPAVTLVSNTSAGTVTLSNGIVSILCTTAGATINQINYTYNNGNGTTTTQLLNGGTDGGMLYWEYGGFGGNASIYSVVVDPAVGDATHGVGNYAEIDLLSTSSTNGTVDVHFSMLRGSPGFYVTAIWSHRAQDAAMGMGETRTNIYAGSMFNWMSVDPGRNKQMEVPGGTSVPVPGAPPECYLWTSGIYQGLYDDKYKYSADFGDEQYTATPGPHRVWGWSSVGTGGLNVGLWDVNASQEYYNCGPMKRELMSHIGTTILNMFNGGHYAQGADAGFAAGEVWSKVYGPYFVYCNNVSTSTTNAVTASQALYSDAVAQGAAEASGSASTSGTAVGATAWPYGWFVNGSYALSSGRGTVSGRIVVSDTGNPNASGSNMLVGVEQQPVTSAGAYDFQYWMKPYEFWVHADSNGNFTIPNVIAGTNYTLYAFGPGAEGEFMSQNQTGGNPPVTYNLPTTPFSVTVTGGSTTNLGNVTWTPTRVGATVFEIGYPDRTARKFRHGDDYWVGDIGSSPTNPAPVWSKYLEYPFDFPNGLTYNVGTSRWNTDWNFVQPVITASNGAYLNSTSTITFTLSSAPATGAEASLYIGLASNMSDATIVSVNGSNLGSTAGVTTTPNSDNSNGYYSSYDECDSTIREGNNALFTDERLTFPGSLLTAGTNTITITMRQAGGSYFADHIMFDYLRMELTGYVPPAPPSVIAYPGYSSMLLSWPATPGATSYNILRSTTTGANYSSIATGVTGPVCGSGLNNATWVDTTATNGTTYYYVVRSTNTTGTSGNSAQSAGVAPSAVASTSAPAAPTGLSATVGNGQVNLNWTASSGANYYTVQRSTLVGNGGGTYNTLSTITLTNTATGTSYTDPTTTNGSTYSYTVLAASAAGTSGTSTSVNAVPLATAPTASPTLTATPGFEEVTLNWSAIPGAVGYVVEVATSPSGPYSILASVTDLTYTDTGLGDDTAYYYTVAATNSGGTSAVSNQASATTNLGTPTNVTAIPGNTQITLTWTPVTGATSYNVQRGSVTGGPYTTIGASGGAAYTDSGLTNGTTYYYVISGSNSAGVSPNSAEVSAIPTGTVPLAPIGLTATGSNGEVFLSWTAAAGATSYTVYRGSTSGGPYVLDSSGIGGTTFLDTGLSGSTTFYYVVEASNSTGPSAYSNEANATTFSSGRTMLTWDSAGASPTAPEDGSGNWDNVTTLWSNKLTDSAWSNSSGDIAVFGNNNGAAGTVTVGGISAGGLVFDPADSGAYTLTSGTVALTGSAPAITMNTGATIGSVLTGSSAITIQGLGSLTLTTPATFSSTINVNNTTVYLSGPSYSAPMLGSGTVDLNGGTIYNVTGNPNTSNFLNPVYVGAGDTGYISFSSRTQWGASGALPSVTGAGTLDLYSGSNLAGSRASIYPNCSIFTGTVNMIGTVADAGFQYYLVNGATGSAYATWNLGGTGTVIILFPQTGGAVTMSLGALTGGVNGVLAGGSGGMVTYSIGANNATTTFPGSILGNSSAYYSTPGNAAVTKVGSGTLILSGSSAYTGATTVSNGVLEVTGSLTSTASVSIASGAVFNLAPGGLLSVAGSITNSGTFILSASSSLGLTGSFINYGTLDLLGGAALPVNFVNHGTVLNAPVITSTLTATAGNGVAFSYQITGSNTPTSYNASGLPAGLTVNTTSGLISGSTTATGTTNVTITASNAGGSGSATLVLTVLPPPPVITGALTATASNGAVFSYQIAATNTPTSYSASGLPAGLTVSATTGLISGSTTATGTSNVTISASNAGGTGNAALFLTVLPPAPVIGSALTATAANNIGFSYQITASNNPTGFGASNLPSGLTVNTTTGVISGTTTATGTSNVSLSASNAGGTGTATLLLTVLPPPPVITSALARTSGNGASFNYQITATNTPSSFAASGLPSGLAVNTSTGVISGSTTATGTSNVVISAINTGGTGTATLALTVLPPPPVISSVLTATATNGANFTYQIGASNSPTSFAASGLPSGLTVNNSTGVISGSTTATGTSNVAISAINTGGTGTATLALTVLPPPPGISSALTATVANGASFSYQIGATNNPTSFNANGLPTGLNINSSTGLISGSTTATGTSSVAISAINIGGTGTATLVLTVLPPPPVISSPLVATATNGANFTYQIAATNSPTSFATGALPSGLNVNATTGVISGSTTETGTNDVAISAINTGGTGTATLVLTVLPPPPVITSMLVATATYGANFSYQITATNNPTGFGAAGLPSGITINTTSGLISGTATRTGISDVTISAVNTGGTGNATLALTVVPPSSIALTWDHLGASASDPADGSGNWDTATALWSNGSTDAVWNDAEVNISVFGHGNGAAGTVTVGNISTGGIAFNPAGSGNYTLTSGTVALSGSSPSITVNSNATIGSVLSGSNPVTIQGTGTLSLTTQTTLTSNIILNNATLDLGGPSFGVMLGTGTLGFEGGTIVNITGGNNTSAFSNPVVVNAGQTGYINFSGRTAWTASSVTGAGTLNLYVSSTTGGTRDDFYTEFAGFAGQVSIIGTTAGCGLRYFLFGGEASGSTAAQWNVGGTGTTVYFDPQTNSTGNQMDMGALSGGTNATLSGGSSGPPTYSMGALGLNTTFAGSITGNSVVSKTGTGTQILSGPCTYTGATNVLQGVLELTGSIAGTSGLNISSGATFDLAGGSLSVAGSIVNSGTFILSGTSPVTYTGSFTNNGTLDLTNGATAPAGMVNDGTINNAPVITGTLAATAYNGSNFTYQIAATNTPTSYAASGLPSGLSVNATTGLISGTTTATGTSSVTISAGNAGGAYSSTLVLTVLPPAPVISSTLTAIATNGAAFSYIINASNNPTSYNATGLPSGLSITGSSGLISGTTTATGTSNVTISAVSIGGTGSAILVLTVLPPPPVIGGTLSATAANGVAFNYQITASNNPSSYGASNLPPGLNVNSATGLISGTTTATGPVNVTVSATNAGGTGNANLFLNVLPPPPVIGSAPAATGTNGTPFSYQITGSNNPTSFNATNLPAGLAITGSTGLISGTPTATGTSNVMISASNAGGSGTATLVLTILPTPPSVTSALTATGTNGMAFSYYITGSNSPTSYDATGLPDGLAVTASTGLISGTPTATGTSNVTISASNAGGSGTAILIFVVLPTPPIITGTLAATVANGVGFNYQITASNNPTSYAATGLPAGLGIDTTAGLISGTTTATGTSNVMISAANAGGSGSATLFLTVLPPPPVVSSTLAATASNGVAFYYQITASNRPTSFGAGNLPAGLNVNMATGLISGTTTATGTSNVMISAANAGGTGSANLFFTVLPPVPVITSATNATAGVGFGFSYGITATNAPFCYNATGLPSGLSVDTTTGIISGTASATGTFPVNISASNAGGTGVGELTLNVISAYNYWASAYFSSSESALGAVTATPEQDGIANGLKYFFDINPDQTMDATDLAGLPVVGIAIIDNVQYMTLTYRENPDALGVTVSVEMSMDMQSWQTVTPDFVTNLSPDPATGDPIIELGVKTNGNSGMFMFLNVTIP